MFRKNRLHTTGRNQNGFTLIEVVLVLAIGGLIFLLAFLAFQQVSVNRRDTQRRADLKRVQADLENFKANTITGAYPLSPGVTTAEGYSFVSTYLADLKDPSTGVAYAITDGSAPTQIGSFMYKSPRICNSSGGTTGSGASADNYAIVWWLEKGGSFCTDNR